MLVGYLRVSKADGSRTLDGGDGDDRADGGAGTDTCNAEETEKCSP